MALLHCSAVCGICKPGQTTVFKSSDSAPPLEDMHQRLISSLKALQETKATEPDNHGLTT